MPVGVQPLFRLFCLVWAMLSVLTFPALALAEGKPATAATRAANARAAAALAPDDLQDFADAQRGFVAPLPNGGRILSDRGTVVWDLAPYAFLAPGMSRDLPPSRILPGPAPDTVHPGLWRQSQLVLRDGLYKVCERIYQVRNADLSNLTIIEGDTGLILADPLVSAETAAAALALYYAHRPHKAVKTVIYSHSHIDHYGGAAGVVNPADVAAGKVQIIAPSGFLQAAIAENVMAGNAMSRRAQYMYGTLLPPSPTGHTGTGLGLKNSEGKSDLISPTVSIERNGQRLELDGLSFIFLLAPDTEAPAEMHWYIPQLKALTAAENCTHTMHNLYTLRGAKARDPLRWSRALDATLQQWGHEAEVLYGMHHWPVWGNARVQRLLADSRDLYRYINDQTLRLANHGLNMQEIADSLHLPPELERNFALRGYYGSLSHNVRGVYTFYLGWFDGNPAQLNPLPPVPAARHYLDYMGGSAAVIKRAREDFDKGEYRWVAQVLNHVIFAEPENREARELAADALEQLGYQAESGPWRNFYLSGARELRALPHQASKQHAAARQVASLPPELFLDFLGVRLNAPKVHGQRYSLEICARDLGQNWLLELNNSVLHSRPVPAGASPKAASVAPVRICGNWPEIVQLFAGNLPLQHAVRQGLVSGDSALLGRLLAALDDFTPDFPLALP